MIKLIRYLVFGDYHTHIWENIEEGPLLGYANGINGKTVKIGNWYDCKCKNCGKMKRFNLHA